MTASWLAQHREALWRLGVEHRESLMSRYLERHPRRERPPLHLVCDDLIEEIQEVRLLEDPLPLDRYAQTEIKRERPIITLNSLIGQMPGVKDEYGIRNVAAWHESIHIPVDVERRDLPPLTDLRSGLEESTSSPLLCHAMGKNRQGWNFHEQAIEAAALAAGLERLGSAKSQRNAPALVIPVWNVHGDRATYQARPDTPRVVGDKPLKYETVAGKRMTLDVPRAARQHLGNPAIPLFITEGARKADAGVSAGLCCIAVLGVWNWRGTNEWGGRTALPDWETIALKDAAGVGREVFIAFDSDVMTKSAVFLALTRLKPFLESRGAVVRTIYLPACDDGSKVGLDDFLAAGNGIDELLSLATDTLREPPNGSGAASDERESQADALVRIGSAGTLFTDTLGDGYARITVEDHRECWPLRSRGFRRWLIGTYFTETGRAPNAEAVTSALNVLEAKAQFEGDTESVFIRPAPAGDDGVY